MIKIQKSGLIDIDRQSLAGLSDRTNWAVLVLADHVFKMYFVHAEERGAFPVYYYKSGAQVHAEKFIKENDIMGAYDTETSSGVIKSNLSKELN